MADIIAQVEQETTTTATVSEEITTSSDTNLAAPAVVESVSNIANVDTTTNGLVSGSILVYKTATSKWTSTTLLSEQNMEGGEF